MQLGCLIFYFLEQLHIGTGKLKCSRMHSTAKLEKKKLKDTWATLRSSSLLSRLLLLLTHAGRS